MGLLDRTHARTHLVEPSELGEVVVAGAAGGVAVLGPEPPEVIGVVVVAAVTPPAPGVVVMVTVTPVVSLVDSGAAGSAVAAAA